MMGAHPDIGMDSPVQAIRGNILVVEEIKRFVVGDTNRRMVALIPQISSLLRKAHSINDQIIPALITWAQRAFDQELDEDLQYKAQWIFCVIVSEYFGNSNLTVLEPIH